MKILVTGASGFVGSHLTEELEKKGHEVFSLSRSEKKFIDFNAKGKLILGDLSKESINKWIENLPEDLDAVIHTAGIVHSFNTDSFYQINSKATKDLIMAFKLKFKKIHFSLISSLAAFGPGEVKETDTPKPVSEYGKSKLAAERSLIGLLPKQWSYSIIRPPMVIGPRDPAMLDVFKMVKNKIVPVCGKNGKNFSYSFVCVFDLVQGIIKSLEHSNEDYFISYPQKISMEELALESAKKLSIKKVIFLPLPRPILKIVGKASKILTRLFKLDLRTTPDKIHEITAPSWVCNSQKAIDTISFVPEYDLSKTLDVTLDYYKENNLL